MEDNIKVLQTKLKLSTDIRLKQESILYELRQTAKEVINILNTTRSGNSLENSAVYTLNKQQEEKLDDLVYSIKNPDLISQRTPDYIKGYAEEIKIKREILDGL